MQRNIFIVLAAYLLKSVNRICLQTKDCKKKNVSTRGRLVTIFYFARQVDRKRTTF